jgi:endoglucanase
VGLQPKFAVWELEDFSVRNGRIHARACDDLIGVASILATLIELKRRKARVNVLGALSRAEEVGFHGALALAAGNGQDLKQLFRLSPSRALNRNASSTRNNPTILPSNSLIISLETSRELPGVKMGQGVILRVGDRASVFDSDASRFLAEVAADLGASRKNFRFQRALMSGGTCEATAYQEFGFQSAAVCIALGNYHNCGKANKIKAEYVSVQDGCSMVELLVEAARLMRQYPALVGKLPRRLGNLLREARRDLRRSSRKVL